MKRSLTSLASTLACTIALGGLATGCASAPRPKSLLHAEKLLAAGETGDLQGARPRLLDEARRFTDLGQAAYNDGRLRDADLYGHIAQHRYLTAQNLVRRTAASRLAVLIHRHETGRERRVVSREVAVERDAAADIDARIAALETAKPLKDTEDPNDTARLDAFRALGQARAAQSKALEANAPNLANTSYAAGANLLESALESLETALYSDAIRASDQAAAAFERAVVAATTKPEPPIVPGVPITPAAPSPTEIATAPTDAAAARDQAEDAITEATVARAEAVAAQGPQNHAELFARGEALLDAARSRFGGERYVSAGELAAQGAVAFRRARAKPAAVATVRGPDDAKVPDGTGGDERRPKRVERHEDGSRLETAIVTLQLLRADMLGQGADSGCPATFRGFAAVLDLAAARFEAGDWVRAAEFAARADERIRPCLKADSGPGTKAVGLQAHALGQKPGASPRPQTAAELAALRRSTVEVQKARAVWKRKRGELGDHPGLAEADTLLDHAEEWLRNQAPREASDLAREATRTLEGLKPLAAAVEVPGAKDAKGGDPPKDPLVDSTPAAVDTTPKPQPGSSKKEALAAIINAQKLLAARRGVLGSDRRLARPASYLDSAQDWFAKKHYLPAERFAKLATTQLMQLAKARPRTTARRKTSKTSKPTQPSKREQLLQRRAELAIERALATQSEAIAVVANQAKLSRPERLLRFSEVRFDNGYYKVSRRQADEARKLFAKLVIEASRAQDRRALRSDTSNSTKRTAPKTRGKQVGGKQVGGKRLADKQPAPAAGGTSQKAAKAAVEAAATAQTEARSRGNKAMKTTFARATSALDEARSDLREGSYTRAEAKADAAATIFDAIPAPRSAAADRSPRDRKSPDRRNRRTADSPEPNTVVVSVLGGPNNVAPASSGAPLPAPAAAVAPWSRPYQLVFYALQLRDRANSRVSTNAHRESMSRGEGHLASARSAWKRKSYESAGTAATAAISEFRGILGSSSATDTNNAGSGRSLAPEDKADDTTYPQADAAVREAKVVLQICDRDQCADRDTAEFLRAKEMLVSAEKSLVAGKHGYAVELADSATAKLNAILAKPRQTAAPPKTIDPEKKRSAENGIADAEIERKLCDARKCSALDLEASLYAQKNLAAAKSAFADSDLDRAKRLADKAAGAFKVIVAAEPTFQIPDDITSVKRSGSQLYLSPTLDFATGSAVLTKGSRDVAGDLAKALKHNLAEIKSVHVIGYTDDRGGVKLNKRLSSSRAKAVADALIRAGLPANLIASEGRGPDNPIADNGTVQGRKANRRVEVHFVLK